MSYGAQIAAMKEPDFFQIVLMALLDQAQAVYTEEASTANHAKRVKLVGAVVKDPQGWAKRFGFLVASGEITTSNSDAEFKARIATLWNAVASGV